MANLARKLTLGSLAAGVVLAAVQGADSPRPERLDLCRAGAQRFLSDPALPPGLALGAPEADETGQRVTFAVQCGPQAQQRQTASSVERAGTEATHAAGMVVLSMSSATVALFVAPPYQGVLPDSTIPYEELDDRAREFAIDHHPVWSRGGKHDLRVRGFQGYGRTSSGYAYLVHVNEFDEDTQLPNMALVCIREFDGKVARFETRSGAAPKPDVVSLPRDRAVAVALQACRARSDLRDRSVEPLRADEAYTPNGEDGRRRTWSVVLLVSPPLDDWGDACTVAVVTVDAYVGTVLSVNMESVDDGVLRRMRDLPPASPAPGTSPSDCFPSWRADGAAIAFQSDRPRVGSPVWAERAKTVFVTTLAGEVSCMVAAPPESGVVSMRAAWSPTVRDRLALWDQHLVVLNTSSGEARLLPTQPDVGAPHDDRPIWAPEGDRLLVSAVSGGRVRKYLAVRRVGDRLAAHEFVAPGRIVAMGPHGVVYLARPARGDRSASPTVALWRAVLPVDAAKVVDESPVLAEFPPIHHASLARDGQVMLLSCEGATYVVDTSDWRRDRLFGEGVFDPDHKDCLPLETRHHTLDTEGSRVAFSGLLRASHSDRGGWYIYTCDVSGAGLRRITRPVAGSHGLVHFPENGATTSAAYGSAWLLGFPGGAQ